MSLHELERLLEEYTPMMSASIEKALDRAFTLGGIFAEVSTYPAYHARRTRKSSTPGS